MIVAALWNHLISLPAVALGVVMLIRAPSISAGYARLYRAVGVKRLEAVYAGLPGLVVIRLAGLAFIGFGVYWAIVGTG